MRTVGRVKREREMLLLDGMATSLASVLICWAVAYFALVKSKGIKVSAAKAIAHIAVIDVALALATAALPDDAMRLIVAAIFATVSCLILRSGNASAEK